jgi:protein TonB
VLLHAAVLAFMMTRTLPAPVQEAKKPMEVIEVEFVEVPSVKAAKAAAPPPVPQEAPKPVAAAPVKPAPKPKPVTAAAPRPAAPEVAKPRPATKAEKPAPRKAEVPVKRAPSQADLARLAAARLKRSSEDVASRLAAIQDGAEKPEAAPAAPERPAGRPTVSNDSPLGELSGRGILSAPQPAYPEVAQRRLWEGTVTVRVFVGADGRVDRAVVEGSSGFQALDQAARGAASRYRFSPLADGEGATQSGVIPFSFVIR